MEILDPNVWVFGFMCLLGVIVSVYCVMLGNTIHKKRQAEDVDVESSPVDEAEATDEPNPAEQREPVTGDRESSASLEERTNQLLEELRETRGSVRRLQQTLDRRAEKDVEERQRFALRLARLVIDAELEEVHDTESAAPPRHRPESDQATSEEPSSGQSVSHRREPAKPEPVPEESEGRRVVQTKAESTPPGT